MLLAVVIWGFTPLLWFQSGQLIATADLFLPITPADWHSQLYLWNSRFGTGAEWMTGPSALLSTGLTAAVMALGGSERLAQQTDFVLWFLLPGLTMWWLLRQVWPDRRFDVARLIAVNLYMFNLFLEALWAGNKAGLSAYAAMPLLLGIVLRAFRTGQWWSHAAAFALASILASGASTNPQVTLVMIIGLFIAVGCYVAARVRSWREAGRVAGFLGLSALLTVGCHAFWFFPQLLMAQDPGMAQGLKAFAKETMGWLGGLSAFTSLYNVARMQGAWTWYQGWVEPYHTYSGLYRESPIWLGLSWGWLALVGLGVASTRRWVDAVFLILAVVGVAFSTGIHPPLGKVYEWMVFNVPFFSLMRSPWYKFTLLTCLGYAYLMGLGGQRLVDWTRAVATRGARWGTRPAVAISAVMVIGLLMVNMVYAFPITTGRMYPTAAQRVKLKPCHVAVPDYLAAAGRWFETQPGYFRIFHSPKHTNGVSVYRWGFSAILPAIYHTTTRPLLFSAGTLAFQESGGRMVPVIHAGLEWKSRRVADLLRWLGVGYLLQEDDFDYDYFEEDGDSPEVMRRRFAVQHGLTAAASFGPWHAYRVEGTPQHAMAASDLILVEGGDEALIPLANARWLSAGTALVFGHDRDLDAIAQALPITRACLVNRVGQPASPRAIAAISLLVAQDTAKAAVAIEPESALDPPAITLTFTSKWDPTTTDGAGHTWRWFTYSTINDNDPHLILENRTGKPLRTNVQFHPRCVGETRDLLVFINGRHLYSHRLEPDFEGDLVMRDVALDPGPNQLRFVTPQAWTERPDGSRASFGFREDRFRCGRLIYHGVIDLPRADRYRVTVWRYGPPQEAVQPLRLALADQTHRLTPQAGDQAWGPVELTLPAGSLPFRVMQLSDVDHFAVLLEAGPERSVPAERPVPLAPVTPVSYDVALPNERPLLLVFRESFHPRWSLQDAATGAPLAVPHWKVNGYANGYWLTEPGVARVRLVYEGQETAWRGWRVTTWSVAICLAILAFAVIGRRR